MPVKAPLRNYQQMVRVVKDSGVGNSYQLANSYGEGPRAEYTDLRLRTLDELGMPSNSLRVPPPTVTGGELSKRASTINYHDLNPSSRNFFNGVGTAIVSRNDTQAGTKSRTELNTHSFNKKIEPIINLSSFITDDKKSEHGGATSNSKNEATVSSFSSFNSK
jgi:hypothetical protein